MKIAIVNINIAKIVLLLLFFSSPIQALELSGVISTDVEYTNNVGLRKVHKSEEIVQSANFDLVIKEDRKNFQADANMSIRAEHYHLGSFDDEVALTTGLGLFNFDLVDSFLNWGSSLSRTQVLSDSADSDTPDNRGYRTIIRTGPAINYNFSRATRIGLTANYVNVENSDEDVNDSEQADSRLSFEHFYNPLTQFLLTGRYETVLEGDGSRLYNNTSVEAGFIRLIVGGELHVYYSRSWLKPDEIDPAISDLFNISLTRDELFWHDFDMSLESSIVNSSVGFESLDTDALAEGELLLRSNSLDFVIRRKLFNLSVSRSLGNFNYLINGFWQKEDTPITKNREVTRGVEVRLEQQYSTAVTFGLEYAFQIHEFIDRSEIGTDKENNYGLDVSYAISSDVSVNGFARYNVRSNTADNARGYEEFSTGFGLRWNLF